MSRIVNGTHARKDFRDGHGDIDRRTMSIFSRSRGFCVAWATSEDLCWHGPESDGDIKEIDSTVYRRLQRKRRLPSIGDTIDFLLEQWMR